MRVALYSAGSYSSHSWAQSSDVATANVREDRAESAAYSVSVSLPSASLPNTSTVTRRSADLASLTMIMAPALSDASGNHRVCGSWLAARTTVFGSRSRLSVTRTCRSFFGREDLTQVPPPSPPTPPDGDGASAPPPSDDWSSGARLSPCAIHEEQARDSATTAIARRTTFLISISSTADCTWQNATVNTVRKTPNAA
jgi:hypothetical protein